MRIGDKVRMLHDNIEGVIIKIINQDQVMIEDTLGFDFPVLKKDLIVVNPVEDEYFDRGERQDTAAKTVTKPKNVVEKGIYLAIIEESKNYGLYLVNNTAQTNFVACYAKNKDTFELLDSKIVNSKANYRASFFPLSTLESWERLHFVIHPCVTTDDEPYSIKSTVKVNPAKIIQAKETIPFMSATGYLKQLDESNVQTQSVNTSVGVQDLQEKMNAGNSGVKTEQGKLSKPSLEIDLHAEKLELDGNLDAGEVLDAQLRVFEQRIESAIVFRMKEITFIHGLGNGTLRKEIHKRIKSYSEVKYFEDAQKSRFGYGATKITFS